MSDHTESVVGFDQDDERSLRGHDAVETQAPEFKLGYTSTVCLLLNRMIGTGIFNTPSIAINSTRSPGIALLFWAAGGLVALAASHVYIEFGLNTPQYRIGGRNIGVPRSGGELNYLAYVFRKPELLSTSVFGIAFIFFGNMAANGIAFAQFIYRAQGAQPSGESHDGPNGAIRAIAIGVSTFACTIHAVSRRGGIYLNNLLALIKVALLLVIIVTGFCAYGGVFHNDKSIATPSNLATLHDSFPPAAKNAYGYAEAFLSVLFAYEGWNQANYVLSEIDKPRKKFALAVPSAVMIVTVLYMLVNVAYMLVVPWGDMTLTKSGTGAPELFYRKTFGLLPGGDEAAARVFYSFLAVSSFGNIVANTFTAARVKQELGKTGILPFPRFFASGHDLSWRRMFKKNGRRPPHDYRRETPVGALLLHWTFSIFLILVTYRLDPTDVYTLLTSIYSYLFAAFFPAAIGLSMLYLRLRPSIKWSSKSPGSYTLFSIPAALILAIGCLFPVVAQWFPPDKDYAFNIHNVPWYTAATVASAVLGSGILYWLGFRFLASRFGHRRGKRLLVEKNQTFSDVHGYPVQDHEWVSIRWVHPEEWRSVVDEQRALGDEVEMDRIEDGEGDADVGASRGLKQRFLGRPRAGS